MASPRRIHGRRRVIQNLVRNGETGLPEDQMFAWRQEVEDLIGLDEYYRIKSQTAEPR